MNCREKKNKFESANPRILFLYVALIAETFSECVEKKLHVWLNWWKINLL